MLDRQIYLDSLRGTPNRLAGPRVVFWWTGPTDPGWPKLSRKGIGVNTPTDMNPKVLNFHIFVELSSITKKGEIERSLLVLVIE